MALAPPTYASADTPLSDSRPTGTGQELARQAAERATLPYNGTIRGLDAPYAVAFNHYRRTIHVTEPRRNRVVVFDRLGRRRGAFGSGVLNRPTALAFDLSGNLAVLSSGSREIVLFRRGGGVIARAPIPAMSPLGLAYDAIGRRLLVTDTAADKVWITRNGVTWTPEEPAGLSAPVGVAAARGRFYVVSSADARLMELSSTGKLIRALPLKGARKPFGITIPPFGNGLVASSADTSEGLFASRLGGPLTRFGGRRRITTPILPGSECTRVALPDFAGNRVVAFDLPNAGSCTQGLRLRTAVTSRDFRRIRATVAAENDGSVSVRTRVSVATEAGRVKRYRLRPVRADLLAEKEKRLRLRVPAAAATEIRKALARRRVATVTLSFIVRNLAGDRRRLVGRLVYRSRALRGLTGAASTGATAPADLLP